MWRQIGVAILALLAAACFSSEAMHSAGPDWAAEVADGVAQVDGRLQLSGQAAALPFVWVANFGEGTVSKLDAGSGAELGRYPSGGPYPSRTAVDSRGNVWVANAGGNTVAKIGLAEAGACSGGADCLLLTAAVGDDRSFPRALAVDGEDNVWVGLWNGLRFVKIDGDSGAILQEIDIAPYRPFGAVIDTEGILWSATVAGRLLRIEPATGTFRVIALPHVDWGLALDGRGHLWVSGWSSNKVTQVRTGDGAVLATFAVPGGAYGRGIAVTDDGHVWVANSGGDSVSRLTPTGALVATIPVGKAPTGLSVDGRGRVWTANYGSGTASRIDPATNRVDGTFSVGKEPFTYGAMTGAARSGTWTGLHDSGVDGIAWGRLAWQAEQPPGTAVAVQVRAADSRAALAGQPWVRAVNGAAAELGRGRYIEVRVRLTAAGSGSPSVWGLSLEPAVRPPAAHPGGPYAGDEGSAIAFDGSASRGDGLTYAWDFGDGSRGEGAHPEHAYGDDGVYTVTLTVADRWGQQSTAAATVRVRNLPPRLAQPESVTIHSGESVRLEAAFSDPGWLDTHSTNFGTRQYFAPGDYRETLRVTDDDGGSAEVQVLVTVLPLPATIDIRPHNAQNPDHGTGMLRVAEQTFGEAVEPSTLRLSGRTPERQLPGHVYLFRSPDQPEEACLTGVLRDGRHFQGCDRLRRVP